MEQQVMQHVSQQESWSKLAIFIIFAVIFAIAPVALAFFLSPRKANPSKEESYECGLHPKGSPWIQFNVQYYMFALVFVIFDIEILYVYPWAVNFIELSKASILPTIEMFVFLGILTIGLAYAWKKGGLTWN